MYKNSLQILQSQSLCMQMQLRIWKPTTARSYSTKITDRQKELMARSLPKRAALPGVESIVVVASGKGGVGKSTTAVNLAVTLAQMKKRVGLLDGDIFGPSIPLMMNLNDTPLVNDNNLMIPLENYGVRCLSMGFLVNPDKPVIWRGPLVMSALQRLLKGAAWGPLDVLIVDTPPGTGDIHLSLHQNAPIDGVLLVSTPQRAALDVTRRGAEMYQTLNVPIIGLIENMRHVICTHCKQIIEIYPNETEKCAAALNVPLLDSLPIIADLTNCCDTGVPLIIKHPDSPHVQCYHNIAQKLLKFLQSRKDTTIPVPNE